MCRENTHTRRRMSYKFLYIKSSAPKYYRSLHQLESRKQSYLFVLKFIKVHFSFFSSLNLVWKLKLDVLIICRQPPFHYNQPQKKNISRGVLHYITDMSNAFFF